VAQQLASLPPGAWRRTASPGLLVAACILLPLNIALEALRWQVLARTTGEKVSYGKAFGSYLAGAAASVITPGRLGEYPARILYLRPENRMRFASAAVVGWCAQLLALCIAAVCGCLASEAFWWKWPLLAVSAVGIGLFGAVFFRAGAVLQRLARWQWMRRLAARGAVTLRFSAKEKATVLGLSALRIAVMCAQFFLLLRWLRADVSLGEGLSAAAVFFWAVAVLPSFALAELGVRGQVSLVIFGGITAATVGVLGATGALWGLNVAVPALAGSLLTIRRRARRAVAPSPALQTVHPR